MFLYSVFCSSLGNSTPLLDEDYAYQYQQTDHVAYSAGNYHCKTAADKQYPLIPGAIVLYEACKAYKAFVLNA